MLKDKSCSICGTSYSQGQWWYLNKYYGLSGCFCPICYDKVSHDAYGLPNDAINYRKLYLNYIKSL